MGGFFNSMRKAVLDHIFGKSTLTPPTIYVGLSYTKPGADGSNITEPSAGAYARVATAANTWNVASSADPAVITNSGTITWEAATADWAAGANMTHVVLFDAVSGGNAIGSGAIPVPRNILAGDIVQIGAGLAAISLGFTAEV